MRHSEFSNLAARLANYKESGRKRAKEKGVEAEFMAARTLTQARKILWGEKQKTPNCSGCSHKVTACVCSAGRRR